MGLNPLQREFSVWPVSAAKPQSASPPIRHRSSQRHFLIVSGPFGPFCTILADRLRAEGARCTRVIANGGDVLDWGLRSAAPYRGASADWGAWLARRLDSAAVTDVIVFGDSCPYSAEAIRRARAVGLAVHVLEEGYFRPHWITLERDGVNGNSRLPREPDAYRCAPPDPWPRRDVEVGGVDVALATRISLYHLGCYLGWPFFSGYRHPYLYSPIRQGLAHLRKLIAAALARLTGAAPAVALQGDGYFLVLLQRPGDSQITRHSTFASIADMIESVIASFALCAPRDARLVVKAHPLDHGIERHDLKIRHVATRLGVADRVFFVEGRPLAPMLARSAGVVTVNSTGGLAALEAGLPTIALGHAIYDLDGLTHRSGIDQFWSAPEPPDPELFASFKRTVMSRTQVNGAFATAKGARLAAEGVARRLLGERGDASAVSEARAF